ncbi:MAG: ABC transporter ATP-binding protein [Bacteroidia bacterium]
MRAYFRILSFGRPWFWLGGLSFVFLLLYTIFSAVSLVSAIPFLEILFYRQEIPRPEMIFSLADLASLKAYGYFYLSGWMHTYGREEVLFYFCFFLLGVILVKNLFRYLASYSMAPLEFGIVQRMRDHIFTHLTTLDLPFFSRNKKGDTLNILTSDLQVIMESVISTVQGAIREPLTMLVFLFTLVVISWKLTLFTLLILPVTALAINMIARPLKRKSARGQEILGDLLAQNEEFITSFRIVKAFQKEKFEQDRHHKINQRYTDTQIGIRRRTELASPLTEVLSIVVVCAIIFVGGTMILGENSSLKASEFIGFIAIFSQFLAPVKTFSGIVSKISRGIASFERVEKLLASRPEVQNAKNPEAKPAFDRSLKFEDVWFRYESADVLKGVSFEIPKGATVAIVGPSGAGKSTLADLIPRFYDPYKGRILMDDTDIRQIRLEDLRSHIGMVTQEGLLFHDTVRNNIAYGLPGVSLAAVEAAARVAYAHDFISELPHGYDTLLGERGTRLSGGQRQRISIARAVLRNPEILILDEATSNLDTESEKLVQQALEHLMANRTSLVIAHRLSTILSADMILVMSEGGIVEKGNHEDLIQRDGLYKRLFELQFSI